LIAKPARVLRVLGVQQGAVDAQEVVDGQPRRLGADLDGLRQRADVARHRALDAARVFGVKECLGQATVADDEALDARRADALGAKQQPGERLQRDQVPGALVELGDRGLRLGHLVAQLEGGGPGEVAQRVGHERGVPEGALVGPGQHAVTAGLPAALDEVREGWGSLNWAGACSRIPHNLE
jgi:hypothetical protein